MSSQLRILPINFRRLGQDELIATSLTGDHDYLQDRELQTLIDDPAELGLARLAQLESKFFLGRSGVGAGTSRLLASRVAARHETVLNGPSLHIIVPTLQCEHSCQYCQVSRSISARGFEMSEELVDAACDTCFESPSEALTVEFQGGDPLIRFDLVRRAIDRIVKRNSSEKRRINLVIASTLHQLNTEMCGYFADTGVTLSTSIDGPAWLHNKNRPTGTRDAYERTLRGIDLARNRIGPASVAALMTTTRHSLGEADAIVDEYVKLGFSAVSLRPLALYGFAAKNSSKLAYSQQEFSDFYERALNRVLEWNARGVGLTETTAAVALNKILCPFDAGYVDLQTPTGAGLATLVYNYDGFVYPSDEARMLAERGDRSWRLGRVGDGIDVLLDSEPLRSLIRGSLARYVPGCDQCAYNVYCGPDPIAAANQFGTPAVPIAWTEHCQRSTWLFDFLFRWLRRADEARLDLAYRWAYARSPRQPAPAEGRL